jgi:hypothetical protein
MIVSCKEDNNAFGKKNLLQGANIFAPQFAGESRDMIGTLSNSSAGC